LVDGDWVAGKKQRKGTIYLGFRQKILKKTPARNKLFCKLNLSHSCQVFWF